MPRALVLVAALVAALTSASAAQAAPPVPTVSIGDATVTPSLVSSYESEIGSPRVIIGDGFGANPPALMATAGATVTIVSDIAVDTATARVGYVQLEVKRVDERTFRATLPDGLVPPTTLAIGLAVTTATHRLSSYWTLDLVAPPPEVVAPPPEPIVFGAPAPAPALEPTARLAGRRLAATVTCAGSCAGKLTVKLASGRRIARWTFTEAGTLRATVSRSTGRRLRGVKQLRAVLTPEGGAPAALSVRLKRAS
jgi:hypothetical protein